MCIFYHSKNIVVSRIWPLLTTITNTISVPATLASQGYFGNKVRLVKAMVFPVVMYGCESWTIKEAEHQRIDAFEMRCRGRLFRIPWTARRSSQSILKEISPGCSLERLMLKLKLQYFGHLMQRADSFEKILMLGKIEDRRRRGQQRLRWLQASPTQWTWVWVKLQELVIDREAWRAVVHGFAKSWTWLSDWTEPLHDSLCLYICFPTLYSPQSSQSDSVDR